MDRNEETVRDFFKEALRDFFAGMALAGTCAVDENGSREEMVEWCYEVADLMIDEKNKSISKINVNVED